MMLAATKETNQHFKLYKVGKVWVIAGIATFSFAFAPQVAAQTTNSRQIQNVQASSVASATTSAATANSVAASSAAASSTAASNAGTSSAVASSAAASSTSTGRTTTSHAAVSSASNRTTGVVASSTAANSVSSAISNSSSAAATGTSRAATSAATQTTSKTAADTGDSSASVTSSAAVANVASLTSTATARTVSAAANNTSASAASSATAQQQSTSVSSTAAVSASTTTTQQVLAMMAALPHLSNQITFQLTTAGIAITNADQLTTEQRQTIAQYAQQYQVVVAGAAVAPTSTTMITIGNVTKAYDDRTDTPVTFEIDLAENVKIPTEWYLAGTADAVVSLNSGDLDFSQVQQSVGTYAITLTAAGLAKLQAANPTLNLTMADVTAGALTITQAAMPSQSISITGITKHYANDSSTNPTTTTVVLPDFLTVPSDWQAVTTDTSTGTATYQVVLSDGDLTDITNDQSIGTYALSLSAAGLAALQAVNPNYTITTDAVKASTFKVLSNYSAIVGSANVTVNKSLPSMLSVTIQDGTDIVPSDWTIFYRNSGQDSVVYNVPMSYFDVSQVDLTTVGTYQVALTQAVLATLQAANPDTDFSSTSIQSGQITIANSTSGALYMAPANYFVTIAHYTYPGTLAYNSGITMTMNLLNFTGGQVNNLTEFIILPSGFSLADVDDLTNATTYTVSTDPVTTLKQDIEATLAAEQINYSDLTVEQLTDYNGRQTFRIQFGTGSIGTGAFNIPAVVTNDSADLAGYIGPYAGSMDSAVMYVTSDQKYTKGAYTINTYGSYSSASEFLIK